GAGGPADSEPKTTETGAARRRQTPDRAGDSGETGGTTGAKCGHRDPGCKQCPLRAVRRDRRIRELVTPDPPVGCLASGRPRRVEPEFFHRASHAAAQVSRVRGDGQRVTDSVRAGVRDLASLDDL